MQDDTFINITRKKDLASKRLFAGWERSPSLCRYLSGREPWGSAHFGGAWRWILLKHYGLTRLASQSKPLLIPEIGLNQILIPDHVSVAQAAAVSGNVSLTEILVLNSLVKRLCPRRIFEFSTFNGRTTLNLALNAPQGAEVFTLDLSAELCDSTGLGRG
jgi:hypothetical protein